MPEGYHHLTYKQRCQIDALMKSGEPKQEIAAKVGIHRSAIYRELERMGRGATTAIRLTQKHVCVVI